jgi:CDP-diacylglycerol---glycerol-3-phosphate 3-phosphatidyltransferase
VKFELISTLSLLGVAALATVAYGVRCVLRGRLHSDRVEKQGGSALLGKSVMEGYYWFITPLSRLLISVGVTPNQISWTSILLGVAAGACMAFGHFGSAAVFATLSAIMDSLDGMVARLTGVASDAGEVLDAAADRYVEFLFLGGLALYYHQIPSLLIVTLFAIAGSFMVSYSTAKAEALGVAAPKGNMRRPERALYLTLGAVLSPVTIPIFELERQFPVPVGHPMVFAVSLVAVLSNLSAIERLAAIARSVRAKARAAELERHLLAEEAALAAVEPEPDPSQPSKSGARL